MTNYTEIRICAINPHDEFNPLQIPHTAITTPQAWDSLEPFLMSIAIMSITISNYVPRYDGFSAL